jgi:chromosome segregation ATPase
MKKMNKIIPAIFALTLTFAVNAEEMKLQEAKEEIARLEQENESLKDALEIYENKIAKHKAKLEEYDNMDMSLNTEE